MEKNSGKNVKRLITVWDKLGKLTVVSRKIAFLNFCKQAGRSIWLSPITFLACLTTVTAALVVLSSVVIVADNIGDIARATQGEISCRFYLKDDVDNTTIQNIIKELKSQDGIKKVEYVDKKDALQEFRKSLSKFSNLLDDFNGENPLPASIIFVAYDKDIIDKAIKNYTNNQNIEYIQYDQEIVARVAMVVNFIKNAGTFIIIALLLITAVIIANAVRLSLTSRNDELVIMRLVGADSFFVKAPCLIEGALYGLLGSILSFLILYFVWGMFEQTLATLPEWLNLLQGVHFLSSYEMFWISFLAILIGVGSSYLAVSRFAKV